MTHKLWYKAYVGLNKSRVFTDGPGPRVNRDKITSMLRAIQKDQVYIAL